MGAPRVLPTSVRLGVVAIAVAIGYRYSLQTLASEWNHDTPLADLALVPALALILVVAAANRHRYVGRLRLGSADYIIAVPLLVLAAALIAAGPIVWSKYFWAMRIDLLTLPLLVAGSVVLLFGLRILFPFALPLAFLLLAWPLPYTAMLEQITSRFTATTTAAVTTIAPALSAGIRDSHGGDGVFFLQHGGLTFSVAIGDACSGVNSLVGFLVVAIAALYFVRGRVARKVAWLIVGTCLVYVSNVLRILGILFAGRAFGERAAIDFVHPVAGLVALAMGMAVLIKLLPVFRLELRQFGDQATVDTPIARPAPAVEQATIARSMPRIGLVAVAAVAIAISSGNLTAAARGFDNLGRPAIRTFAANPTIGPRWRVSRVETIGWAKPYYGEHSSWVRYRLRPTTTNPASKFTIWLDAVVSPDLGALNAYTLGHCYAFHGFEIQRARRVDLGNGVVGQTFTYKTSRATWHAVAWQWPVLRAIDRVGHERIVLIASTTRKPNSTPVRKSGPLSGAVLALENAGSPGDDENAQLTTALVSAGAAAVAARVAR